MVAISGCGNEPKITDPCDALHFAYPDGLLAMEDATTSQERHTLASIVPFVYGDLVHSDISRAQQRDLEVMLDAARAGGRGDLAPAERDAAIAAYRRFDAELSKRCPDEE